MHDLEAMPGHLIRRFQQIAVAIFHAEVAAAGYDLTPVQFAALTRIAENPDIDQATLAGLIAYDRTTIGGVLDRLLQRELIVRTVSPTDRRARSLTISPAGRRMLEKTGPAVAAAQRKMLAPLDEREGAELMRLLRKATEAGNLLSRAPLRQRGGS